MSRRKSPRSGSPRSADPVTDYAERVTDGRIIAGPHVRDACARHLRDLKDGPRRGLVWDLEAAQEAFRFYREILRLNGGEFEGREFELDPSQYFIVGSLFGWKAPDSYRRFRVAYIEEGKGNGKSPLVAGIGLKMLVADKEPRAEVYAAATKKDQAQILFRDAVAMVDQSPDLDLALHRAGGKGREWNISDPASASFFRCVSSDDAQSGPRPHCALLDEVHEHKSGMMIEMMRAGTKGRRQALIVMITNSGTDRQSVCWQYHEYAAKVASGMEENDAFFSYVCALDEGDDPMHDESCWVKANPLLGVSIPRKYLEEQVREARGMPSKESKVRRLNFCQWVEAVNPWLSHEIWTGARDADFDADLLVGRRCFGGLDLASTTDLTAFVLLFEPTENDPHWRQKAWFWMPQASFDGEKRREYPDALDAWRAAGWIEATPGKALNKLIVLARLVEITSRYDVVSIGYDRWRIEDLKMLMSDEGVELPLEPFGQGFKDMAPGVDEYERLLIADDLKHDGNNVMTYCAGCAVLEQDPAGNRKPTKAKSNGRIDGIVAAVMAAGRALAGKEAEPEVQMLVL
jgi:phage terminase large subunit-like protein